MSPPSEGADLRPPVGSRGVRSRADSVEAGWERSNVTAARGRKRQAFSRCLQPRSSLGAPAWRWLSDSLASKPKGRRFKSFPRNHENKGVGRVRLTPFS